MARTILVAFKLDKDKADLLEFAAMARKLPNRSVLIRKALDEYLDWDELQRVQALVYSMVEPEETIDEIEDVVLKGRVLGG